MHEILFLFTYFIQNMYHKYTIDIISCNKTGDTTDENENGQDATPTTDCTMDDDKAMVPTVGGVDISQIMFNDEEKKEENTLPSFPYNQFSNSRSNASNIPLFHDNGVSNSTPNANNNLPIIPWKNNSNSVPSHRRLFSEGPKNKRNLKKLPTMSITDNGFLSEDEDEQKMMHKQASYTAGGDIDELRDNENIKEDEFIIIGDDENDGDNNHNQGVTPIGSIDYNVTAR